MGIPTSVARVALFVGVFGLLAARSAAATDEVLDYSVTYRGVFSLGKDMPIADLALHTRAGAGDAALRETRLDASSAAYPIVEALYPIRYRFRTWSTSAQGALIGFETFEKTTKLRHRLYLGDASGLGVELLDLAAGAGRSELAQLDAGRSPPSAVAQTDLVDRLGLLQRIRAEPLRDRAEYRFAVTNGREALVYRVKVEGGHTLDLGGRRVAAWKLRLDGVKTAADGTEEAAHRPVYLWLSQTPDQIPLRADSHHPVGLFRIELALSPALDSAARAGP